MIPPEIPGESGDTRAFRPAPASLEQDVSAKQPTHDPMKSVPRFATSVPPPQNSTDNLEQEHQQHPASAPISHHDQPHPFEGARFLRDPTSRATSSREGFSRSASQSPFRIQMPSISPGQLAFSALQYLPVPTLVLNSLKTVVIANEALGRMLGIVRDDVDEESASYTLERLRGQTLSQVGIDMLQDGKPVWVTWEAFLDNVVHEMGVRSPVKDTQCPPPSAGDDTPTQKAAPPFPSRGVTGRQAHDAVVEVVVSRNEIAKTTFDSRHKSTESDHQVFAKMIISIWELEDRQTYFTLTFTNTQSTPSSLAAGKKSIAKPSILEAAEKKTITTPSVVASNPPSVASSRENSSPSFYSPTAVTMSSSPFPPMGPPSIASRSNTPSVLQKMIRMKDALLDNTQVPVVAMWKDGSVSFPNKAARRLFRTDAYLDPTADGFDLLANWAVWDEDFTRCLDISEYPLSILLKTEAPFESIRCGVYDDQGNKLLFDCMGEAIYDDHTGEFLAGVVTGRDVTSMTREITEIKESSEERFKLICDTMPQLVWTATADGSHDFFNTRWYTYTGLKPEECLGLGWKNPFHPDDLPEALARWHHSLRTGDPYSVEYRCRSKDGEWRWFLGRALAIRNRETGAVEKWFGTYPSSATSDSDMM